ncbi:TonB-dependent siderophore receptor [Microvirga lotononidis]|uniref:TonB-dependent siderophore receptor n=1 Tax=Microvirga lotononidis TaxID=864069 RepID=I4Z1T7_9HYPH|nr:TonB-dependent siderophore receptor [Microvirga lotononidis]EIM30179.1 TonB-dependent siderophore receptor [Microvirga lotononidis]WQO31595.1 TonB-dependent siderophore receptor [Microvirga lotononidis]
MVSDYFTGGSYKGLRGVRLLSLSGSLLFLASAALAQDAIQLETITVEGESTSEGGVTADGYVATRADVGTKTDTPLVKVPQTINVVTQEQLEDRNVQTLKEALAYTPGVRTNAFGFDNRFDSFSIRGFDVTYTGVYRDGLRELNGNFSIFKTEPYGLDAISILKGPSSVLYGGGSPGGIVNLVTKRPTEQVIREIEGQVGNHDRYQGQFDLSGPVVNNDNILYRLTGLFRSSNTELLSVPDDRIYIAPALTFRSDDRNTSLTLLGEYSHFQLGGNSSFFNENGRITSLESGDPAFGTFVQDQARIGYEFKHRFNDTWSVRQNLRYAHIFADLPYTQIDSITPDRLFATRSTGLVTDRLNSFAVDNQAQANFQTGTVDHTLLMGLDYTYVNVNDRIGFGAAPNLDLNTLNYGQQPIFRPTYNFRNLTTEQSQTGIYVQDQLEWNRFILTLGGRHDWLISKNRAFNGLGEDSEQSDKQFSGRVGLGYLFDSGIAPYVSYSTSFAPTVGASVNGTPFKPTEGEQVEAGVKYKPSDLNLSASAAVFRIIQSNVLTTDPNNINFQVQEGEVRSQGLELEATTGLPNGLNLTVAYTYLDLEITQGDNAGNVPSSIPAHQFAIWGDYTFQDGAAEGLELGLGLRYSGTSYGDSQNTFENDARLFVDALVSYDLSKLNPSLKGAEARLNVKNLFDKREPVCESGYCYLDEGRQIIGSLRYRF